MSSLGRRSRSLTPLAVVPTGGRVREGLSVDRGPAAGITTRSEGFVTRRTDEMILAAVVTAIAFGAALWRHNNYRSLLFDLGVYDQAVWMLSRGETPVIASFGWNAFGDHFSLVLFGFAGLYRVTAHPAWFFAAQAAALGTTLLVVGPFLSTLGLDLSERRLLIYGTAISPLLWNAVMFDFHTSTLAVPVLAIGLHAASRDRVAPLVGAAVALALLRDDLAALSAVVAIVGFAGSSHRRIRIGIAVASVGFTVAGSAFAESVGVDRHWDGRYGHLGESAGAALASPIDAVLAALDQATRPAVLVMLVAWVLTLGGLPLLGWRRLLVAVALAAPMLIATDDLLLDTQFHYGAPYVPFLVWAAADGIRRLRPLQRRELTSTWVLATAAVSMVAFGPHTAGVNSAPPYPTAAADTVVDALEGTSLAVVVDDRIGPHVSQRATVVGLPYLFDPSCQTGHFVYHLGSDFPIDERIDVLVLPERIDAPRRALLDELRSSRCLESFDLALDLDGLVVLVRSDVCDRRDSSLEKLCGAEDGPP